MFCCMVVVTAMFCKAVPCHTSTPTCYCMQVYHACAQRRTAQFVGPQRPHSPGATIANRHLKQSAQWRCFRQQALPKEQEESSSMPQGEGVPAPPAPAQPTTLLVRAMAQSASTWAQKHAFKLNQTLTQTCAGESQGLH